MLHHWKGTGVSSLCIFVHEVDGSCTLYVIVHYAYRFCKAESILTALPNLEQAGLMPLGSAIAMRFLTWSAVLFGWVVRVSWHPHEHQGQRFPNRILHCNKMIDVNHFTCQGFWYCGWWVYVKYMEIRAWMYIYCMWACVYYKAVLFNPGPGFSACFWMFPCPSTSDSNEWVIIRFSAELDNKLNIWIRCVAEGKHLKHWRQGGHWYQECSPISLQTFWLVKAEKAQVKLISLTMAQFHYVSQ